MTSQNLLVPNPEDTLIQRIDFLGKFKPNFYAIDISPAFKNLDTREVLSIVDEEIKVYTKKFSYCFRKIDTFFKGGGRELVIGDILSLDRSSLYTGLRELVERINVPLVEEVKKSGDVPLFGEIHLIDSRGVDLKGYHLRDPGYFFILPGEKYLKQFPGLNLDSLECLQ